MSGGGAKRMELIKKAPQHFIFQFKMESMKKYFVARSSVFYYILRYICISDKITATGFNYVQIFQELKKLQSKEPHTKRHSNTFSSF